MITEKLQEILLIADLNSTYNGELLVINVNNQLPWWLEIFGLKPKPIINKIISTDYTNYAIVYFCNEGNNWFKHDEVYYLLRDIKKASKFLEEAKSVLNKIGYDEKKMKKIDQESKLCEKLITNSF